MAQRVTVSAAPPGRVQASSDFDPASYGAVLHSSSQDYDHPGSNHQYHHHHHHAGAGLSVRGSSDASNSSDFSFNADAEGDQDDGASSILSDFASIFHPNEYILAQQRIEQASTLSEVEENHDEESLPILSDHRARRSSSLLAGSSNITFDSVKPIQDADVSGISLRQALASPSTSPGTNLGLLLIAVSQISYSTMNLFVKILDEREGRSEEALGALEIVGVECLIIWIGCTLAMCVARTEHILLGPPGTRSLLFARGMFGFASTLALYISLHSLSLSDATVITFLSPLATGVLASLTLHEPFTRRERIAGILSLGGVVLIARPSFLFGSESGKEGSSPSPEDGDINLPPDDGSDQGHVSEAGRIVGILVAMAGVWLMAGAWVCLRRIGKRASTYHSISYFALCSWVSSFAAMWILNQPFVIPTSQLSLLLLIGVGLFSLLAQVFQTLGLQRENAGRAATMSYLQIIFALIWQFLMFHSVPDWVSILGSIVILASGAWVALSKAGNAAPAH